MLKVAVFFAFLIFPVSHISSAENISSGLHLQFISNNADLVALSNDKFYIVYPEFRHIVSRWSLSDLLEIRHIEEPGPEGLRDSSPGKDFETYLHGSPHSVLKDRDCGLSPVQPNGSH